ncbi:hypothetical protein [Anaeromicropila herbilytica]|uniref:Uncharacterized protein n=1 Tax=Anaeromicropila herbilytica TaxID=2785025 RepID=A0A7R7EP73_9FIRM|nr:hypothetical protein [Anaeromicropila herbilytica]BCN32236.1 hypothetical protein bsdtb5_35310 [Anaeromicropila herbilytica]
MNMFNPTMTLYEIEERLEKEFINSRKYLRIIGDLDLSVDDFKYLSLKIKGLKKLRLNISMSESYKLALLTSFVFTIKKEQENSGSVDGLLKLYQGLPQHHKRYYMKLLDNTLEEYGITTFGMNTSNMHGIFTVLLAHAGIPVNLHTKLYDILDESLKIGKMHVLESKLRNEFLPQLNWMVEYMDEKYLWKICNECRDLLIDCKINEIGHRELFEKYDLLSSKLILSCIKWCDDAEDLRQSRVSN